MKSISSVLLFTTLGLAGIFLLSTHGSGVRKNNEISESVAAATVSGLSRSYLIANTNIDMEGFLRISQEAANHRKSRRVSEDDFIRLGQMPGTLILDARSREMFELLHIEGAVNLSFPDITIASLAKTIPDKNTRILIYCNNNFQNSPRAFASKSPAASLNLSTYISLYSYGYKNVFELAPFLDIHHTKIKFVSGSGGG